MFLCCVQLLMRDSCSRRDPSTDLRRWMNVGKVKKFSDYRILNNQIHAEDATCDAIRNDRGQTWEVWPNRRCSDLEQTFFSRTQQDMARQRWRQNFWRLFFFSSIFSMLLFDFSSYSPTRYLLSCAKLLKINEICKFFKVFFRPTKWGVVGFANPTSVLQGVIRRQNRRKRWLFGDDC